MACYGKKELELVLVKSFIPDINDQDSRILDPSPYTTVNAYLVGTEDWNSSVHHLMSVRCNLDAGEAKIMYYNDGIGYGYCMCPSCGKMELEKGPYPSNKMKGIPAAMISETNNKGIPCHHAIDRIEDNGRPKLCIPPKNIYYRNVIIGGLIQTDFCEMRIKKIDNTPVNKLDDKSFLTTLGLVLCNTFTDYIGKERNSVDFTIMLNGNLCIFDTNPGGSGYSNKLNDSQFRLEILRRSKDMLESIKDKEELLDKFTVRYLNDIDIDATKAWLIAELLTWDTTPNEVKNSKYSYATWANYLDILKDFKESHESGVLFCNENFENWNYASSDIAEARLTWEHRVREIIQKHSTGPNKVKILIPTDQTVPTKALSVFPQNGWATIYSTGQHMDNNFHPLACVNDHLYFTDDAYSASMNGEWAKGSVFCISSDKYDFSQHSVVKFNNEASTCVFYLNTSETEKCESTELANIVLDMAKDKGLEVDDFFRYCKKNKDLIVNISYVDEHFKSVTGMITTMHFIDSLLKRMGRKNNFHVKFINEKYYTASNEVYTPWLNIEKWERRNSILEKLANHWIESKGITADKTDDMWENDCQKEKSLAHWRVLTIKCGDRKLNIYPHGGIINEWQVDRSKNPSRRYLMNDTTDLPIPLVRINPIMYIIEIDNK